MDLNYALDQMYLTHIYQPFHQKTMEYMFFSTAHGTFSSTDDMY